MGDEAAPARLNVITSEDVAPLRPEKRAGALLALFRADMRAQGVVVLTAGMLRSAAPLLALLHAERPITSPRQVPGRALFAIHPVEEPKP